MRDAVQKAVLLILMVLPLLTGGRASAMPRGEADETARLLAALLNAGRIVIDRNQSLIDDQHKGNKGFTPEVFEKQLNGEFLARTGIDLTRLSQARVPPMAGDLLRALIQASKDVVADAQLVINQRGVGYKNFIPATFGSQAASRFSAKSHVRLKQTALQPRNEKNQPDPYEAAVLQRLATQPNQTMPLSEATDGGKTLRVLTPIYYTKDCLKCHGGPAGEQDISGYPKEGAREGDLAGAISVTIPLADR
jgi:general secretion pathway protein A